MLRELGTPLLIHQPSYSMLNRWIEPELLDVLGEEGVGCIVFSPIGQGMLTDKYLGGIPEDSRAAQDRFLKQDFLTDENLARVRALNEIAQRRGQSLAQMAIAWTLRDPRVTSALIGASSVEQLEQNVAALDNLDVLRRRAGGDRPLRGRLRHQPLGGVQRGLKHAAAASLRPDDDHLDPVVAGEAARERVAAVLGGPSRTTSAPAAFARSSTARAVSSWSPTACRTAPRAAIPRRVRWPTWASSTARALAAALEVDGIVARSTSVSSTCTTSHARAALARPGRRRRG